MCVPMKRLWIIALALCLALAGRAEDQLWTLADGSKVTVIKVLSQSATHVTVRCPDGILQIDKRRLSDELKAQYPYDEAAARAKAVDEELARDREQRAAAREQKAAAPAKPKAAQGAVALEILGVRAAEDGVTYVTIANRTDMLHELARDAMVGVNVNGARFPVSRYTNPRGDVLTKVRLLPNATTEVGVVFKVPEGAVGVINMVYWVRH